MASPFKAYDIRGRLGDDLDEAVAFGIGQAFAATLQARQVVLGRDCRASSAALADAVAAGLMDQGVSVLDIGLAGTEEMYWAVTALDACGGIEVTASHNPMDYNGMKLVGRGSAPLTGEESLQAVKARMDAGGFQTQTGGSQRDCSQVARAAYVEKVLGFVDIAALRPMTILVNAGNGAAGPTFDAIAAALAERGAPLQFVRLHHTPDGRFPNGIPNPLLPENQPVTAEAVRAAGADFGVAWDGDFDRCFFFDHAGGFVAGEYVVGLLAEAFLAKSPGEVIVHDPRVVWNTQATVARAQGRTALAPVGHIFQKLKMRETMAIYGGEISAHHYFRDFAACDSGMIPWLLIAELLSRRQQTLEAVLAERRAEFPSSGEINFRVTDAKAARDRVLSVLGPQALSQDDLDGVSLTFADWRMNLRSSNTEPLFRLNVESRANPDLIAEKVALISGLITG